MGTSRGTILIEHGQRLGECYTCFDALSVPLISTSTILQILVMQVKCKHCCQVNKPLKKGEAIDRKWVQSYNFFADLFETSFEKSLIRHGYRHQNVDLSTYEGLSIDYYRYVYWTVNGRQCPRQGTKLASGKITNCSYYSSYSCRTGLFHDSSVMALDAAP